MYIDEFPAADVAPVVHIPPLEHMPANCAAVGIPKIAQLVQNIRVWSCIDTSYECDTCAAKKYCSHWEGEDE